MKPSQRKVDRSFVNGRSPTKANTRPLTATATPITAITLGSNAWSSIIARLLSRMRPPLSSRTHGPGKLEGSPASDAIAGPLQSLTKKAKRRGWSSITCGTARRYPGGSPELGHTQARTVELVAYTYYKPPHSTRFKVLQNPGTK